MKKFFNHTKRPYTSWEEYEAENDDWDAGIQEDTQDPDMDLTEDGDGAYYADGEYAAGEDGEYYPEEFAETDESEYYAEESLESEEAEYYAEEGLETEEAEYYAEESLESEEAEYYAEEGLESEEAEYYAEEGLESEEAEYYAEEGLEAEEAEYYAEESLETEETEYYAEEGLEAEEAEYYAEEHDHIYADSKVRREQRTKKTANAAKKRRNGNVFLLLWDKFLHMGAMDRIITATGVAVLILGLVTGSVYVSARMIDGQIEDFVSVGAQLGDITLIGEKGLMAVADAEAARSAAAEIVEEEEQEQKEYNEAEYEKNVTVNLELTSVLKDLKVKFTNQKTDKLVANVPFSVTVTDPSGKSETWTDDDMDGVIYKTELTPGKYKVALNALTDEKYKDYTLSSETKTVEVKKDIEYKKVDVKNEVKKESEINASKEDTKKNETQVESSLQDTVNWVESTQTSNTYVEVAKSSIADPTTYASSKSFLRMANEITVTPGAVTLQAGKTTTVTANLADIELAGGEWSSDNESVATVAGNGASATVTAVAAGSATIKFSVDTVSGNTQTYTGSCTITVTAAGTVTLNPSSVSVAVKGTAVVQASAQGIEGAAYEVASGDTNIAKATVEKSGKITVTGVAAGSTSIQVKATGKNGTSAETSLAVTVTGNNTITLDKTAATIFTGTSTTITAAIGNASTQNPVTAESGNTGVATVAVSGRTVTVSGVAPGSATITIKYSENGGEAMATCTVTVKAHPKDDKTNKLKDTSGRQLYVQEGDSYREAVYADYYSAEKFFVKGEIKYTGWQTLDGKVYFFDASGKKVTGEQVIQGAKYNFASDGSLVVGSGTMGIDVSKWNGNIDWNAVKNSGVSYVIIRCGYRGSSAGSLIEDPKYTANIKGATAAGLKVGVYFFTQAVNEVEAVEEASMVLEQVKNYKISYPIFLDVESSGGRADGISKATRTAVCKAFCQTIQQAGYTAGIYANKNWLENKIDAGALSNYKIWLAQYAAAPTYKGRYDLWQYKSTGKVSGISGNVDLNLSYLGY